MNKSLISLGGLAAAVILFVAFNIVSGAALRSARLDLTESRLYTLSQGSRNIAAKLEEPITLSLYYSEKQAAELPGQIRSYAQRVKEVLREYAAASNGTISLEFVNPEPFSDAEDRAVQANLAGIPVGRGSGGSGGGEERFYFGLVGSNSTDRTETIAFFRPDREEFLEYELTRMIYLLSDAAKKTIGVMTWLPLDGGGPNPMTRQPAPPWQIYSQLNEVFTVKKIPTDAAEIPADIQVLLVVHPKNISDAAQYAIDQYILKGGHAVIFVDPLCENDVPPGVNPMQAMGIPKNSSLPKLFGAWGLEMPDGLVAADRSAALRVSMGSEGRPEAVDYVAWLALREAAINQDDPITGQLNSINVATGGFFKRMPDASVDMMPLLHTSTDSMAIAAASLQMPQPKELLANFVAGGEHLTIAARVTGKPRSAFAAAPTPTPDPNSPTPEAPPATKPHTAEAAQPINVVLVADCDMLVDRLWVREERLGGQFFLGYTKLADNGDFVLAALDNLSGSSDLISVRARGKFARPFDKVNQIQRDAEQKFLQEEQALQKKLQDTEREINELQRQRPDQNGGGNVLLTPEQAAKIESFRKEQVETRKKLRDVQHQLRKDIETLGTQIKFLNIGLMPLLIGVAALGLSTWRVRRRRQDRSRQ